MSKEKVNSTSKNIKLPKMSNFHHSQPLIAPRNRHYQVRGMSLADLRFWRSKNHVFTKLHRKKNGHFCCTKRVLEPALFIDSFNLKCQNPISSRYLRKSNKLHWKQRVIFWHFLTFWHFRKSRKPHFGFLQFKLVPDLKITCFLVFLM